MRSARRSSSNVGRAPLPAQGEVHVQVATLRESSSDYRKFYIHTGTTTLSLRAETTWVGWTGGWDGGPQSVPEFPITLCPGRYIRIASPTP